MWLAERGWDVVGVDIASTAIGRADRAAAAADLNVRFVIADAREWEPGSEFDLVISTYALGNRRDAILAMAANAVAPGGTAYISEFEKSAQDLWSPEDLVSVDELVARFGGFVISRAEVLTLHHDHGHERTEWPVAILVAQRPVR